MHFAVSLRKPDNRNLENQSYHHLGNLIHFWEGKYHSFSKNWNRFVWSQKLAETLEYLTNNKSGRAFHMLYDNSGDQSVFIVGIVPAGPMVKNEYCSIYRSSSLFPKAIAVQDDGGIIIANQVNGFTVSRYLD